MNFKEEKLKEFDEEFPNSDYREIDWHIIKDHFRTFLCKALEEQEKRLRLNYDEVYKVLQSSNPTVVHGKKYMAKAIISLQPKEIKNEFIK